MGLKILFRSKENQEPEILGQIDDSEKSKGWWASTISKFSGSRTVATVDGDYVSNGPKGKVETIDKDDYRDSYTS